MKYINARQILPAELIEQIQQYADGEYIYIPVKSAAKTTATEYRRELEKRDRRIYVRSLEGVSKRRLADIYNLSPSSVRRIIIGQRKQYEHMKELITELTEEWRIGGTPKQIYDTVWQIGDGFVLKVYHDEDKLRRSIRINASLGEMGIPVAKTLPTCTGKPYIQKNEYFFHISERLPGKNTISLKNNTEIGFEMGKIIARLHCAFRECEELQGLWQSSLPDEMNGWIREAFEKSGWKYIEKSWFYEILHYLEKHCHKLYVQPIHRDVHFGNFLFDNGSFSGYIDFDLSQKNVRIFDLCYFVLSVLSEKDKLEITEGEWFALLENTFAGYHSLCELSAQELEAVPCVMEAIELLFVAWCINEDDRIAAENAAKIFRFVESNADKIAVCTRCGS